MTKASEIQKRRRAALAVCGSVPRSEVRGLLDMLGLLPLEPATYVGTPWFDTGLDGGRAVMSRPRVKRTAP